MEEQELKISEEAKRTFRESTKWMKFMGIIGYISASFMTLGGIIALLASSFVGIAMQTANFLITGIVYIVMGIISFIPATFLTRAARNGKIAILSNDNQALTDFFRSNKSYWKFNGILTIIGLSLAVLAIFFVIIAICASGIMSK